MAYEETPTNGYECFTWNFLILSAAYCFTFFFLATSICFSVKKHCFLCLFSISSMPIDNEMVESQLQLFDRLILWHRQSISYHSTRKKHNSSNKANTATEKKQSTAPKSGTGRGER